MADYDPAHIAPDNDIQDQRPAEDADDEDDEDYDPSSYNVDNEDDLTTNQPSQTATPSASTPQTLPPKPKTVGGFVVDEDDEDEEDVVQQDAAQSNGTGPNTAIASEPAHEEDTSAPSTTPLNGSSSVVVTASAPDTSPTSSTLPASAPALSFQDQGKQDVSSAATPLKSASATPQPSTAAAASQPPMATTQAPAMTQRLPHDKVGQLEDRIKEDPKADAAAWRELISYYREKNQLDNARKVYARFFDVFPSASAMYVEQIQMELAQDNFPAVENIFSKCLLQLPNVDMWSTYIDYLRRIHPVTNDPDGSKRGIISQAFELLLEHVGIDPDSGKLWRDYVDFIKGGPGVVGATGWQDAQKGDLLRKAYQRAVRTPHSELTKLWKEYDNFELGINKMNGRKFLQEQSPHYMTARTARTQLEQKIDGLDRLGLPKLPPAYGCAGEDEFADQVEKWRGWVEWEKEDPLVIRDEDIAAYRKRIIYAYRQATMQLRFYPGIWFEAASWCFEQGVDDMVKQGDEFLDLGIAACPESVLLALKKADRVEGSLERGGEDEVAVRNGEKLDPVFEACHKALYALNDKMKARLTAELAKVQEYFDGLPPQDDDEQQMQAASDDEDDGAAKKPQTRAQQLEAQLKLVRMKGAEQQDTLKRTISYLWVAKMRAFRRIQGQGQPKQAKKGFRGVFAEARPRGQLTSEVYIASALMEWVCYQDRSAEKIFDRGLKLFPTDEVFALEYIKHLIANNDHTNARAVFETTLTKITKATESDLQKQREKCRPLILHMHTFESQYGDLDKIYKLEKRMAELYPDVPVLRRFSERFALPSFNALDEQLVLSPTQILPLSAQHTLPQAKALPTQAPLSPPSNIRLGPNGPYLASPKRSLDDVSDPETPQRKFARNGGDSPLKGAAGRRLQHAQAAASHSNHHAGGSSGGGQGFITKNYVPGSASAGGGMASHPAPLPYEIHHLLSVLPHARVYNATVFDPAKVVELLRGLGLPVR